MRLTYVVSKSRCERAAATTTEIPNHLPKQIEILACRFLYQEDSTAVRRIPSEHEWIDCLAIYQGDVGQAMEALKFLNPVENGPVRRRIEVRFADNVHEGSVVVTKERDEPPTSE